MHSGRSLAARALVALAPALLTAPVAGAVGRGVPAREPAPIADQEAVPLPRSATAEELLAPLPTVRFVEPPPTGELFTPPEYAKSLGLLIRWGSFDSVLTAMTVAITAGDPEATVWIVVASSSQQASAAATLAAAGADLSQVGFLIAPSNSIWIRDYGPRFVLEDKHLAIIDHVYNRPRPLDDAIPDAVAAAWSLPSYDLPLVHGGGNFHLRADGEADMTELVLAENPGLSESEIRALFLDYENLDVTIRTPFPTSYDSTQHIDMWLLPARDRAAIVGEYPAADVTPHAVTEAYAAELAGRGFQVFRTPGWRSSGTHYTYTNAVILNRLVLVPQYSGWTAQNQAALSVFAQAFPGYQVIPIDATQLVTLAGVLHCIVMHVPDPDFLFWDDFETGDSSAWSLAVP